MFPGRQRRPETKPAVFLFLPAGGSASSSWSDYLHSVNSTWKEPKKQESAPHKRKSSFLLGRYLVSPESTGSKTEESENLVPREPLKCHDSMFAMNTDSQGPKEVIHHLHHKWMRKFHRAFASNSLESCFACKFGLEFGTQQIPPVRSKKNHGSPGKKKGNDEDLHPTVSFSLNRQDPGRIRNPTYEDDATKSIDLQESCQQALGEGADPASLATTAAVSGIGIPSSLDTSLTECQTLLHPNRTDRNKYGSGDSSTGEVQGTVESFTTTSPAPARNYQRSSSNGLTVNSPPHQRDHQRSSSKRSSVQTNVDESGPPLSRSSTKPLSNYSSQDSGQGAPPQSRSSTKPLSNYSSQDPGQTRPPSASMLRSRPPSANKASISELQFPPTTSPRPSSSTGKRLDVGTPMQKTSSGKRKSQRRSSNAKSRRSSAEAPTRPSFLSNSGNVEDEGSGFASLVLRKSMQKDPVSNEQRLLHTYEATRLGEQFKLNPTQISDARGVFDAFDQEGLGTLSRENFLQLLQALIRETFPQQRGALQTYFPKTDMPYKHRLSFEEFLERTTPQLFDEGFLNHLADKRMQKNATMWKVTPEDVERLKKKFDEFDDDRSGWIDFKEFRTMVKVLLDLPMNMEVPRENIAQMWREADADGSGQLDFDEFLVWYYTYFADEDTQKQYMDLLFGCE